MFRRGGSAPRRTPLTIVTSTQSIAYFDAALGVTIATGVSAWANQNGIAGRDVTQGTGANQPTYSASDPNFGGQPSLTFDGVNDVLSAASGYPWAAISGGFQPYFWAVIRQATWVVNNGIWSSSAAGNGFGVLQQLTVTPQLRMFSAGGSASNENTGAPVAGVAARIESSHTNSAADFLKCGATNVTGTNCGAGLSTATLFIGSLNGSANFWAGSIAAMGWWMTLPTIAERAALSAYVTARWGGTVLV